MTERLYYEDSHIKSFAARVESCSERSGRWAVELDRTAFFPGGGGQAPDTGSIGPARVTEALEEGGRLLHLTDAPLKPGEEYDCAIDWEKRFSRMQHHSGEHIVSGIVYGRWGFNNVGFHMNEDFVTIDFDGELGREELDWVEAQANRAVCANLPFKAELPEAGALAAMQYRSKLALTENVRIVTVEGIDRCACCAPHVKLSGEIGAIKLLDFMRHRGGVRLELRCGAAAMADYREKYASVAAISALLSAKQGEVAPAAERLLREKEACAAEAAALRRSLALLTAQALPEFSGNRAVFRPELDMDSLRLLVSEGMKKTSGVFAAFTGSQEEGWRFAAGGETADMAAFAGAMRSALGAKCGGGGKMIQGGVAAAREAVEAFFAGAPEK